MRISQVKIENFRALKEITLECDPLTAIIGRNGSGKSTVLKALEVFYNVSYQASPFDYFAKDTALSISIAVTYTDLRPRELQEFAPYLQDKHLTVTKIVTSGGARYFGVTKQHPEFVKLRGLAATPKRVAWNELVSSNSIQDLGEKATSQAQVDEQMAKFEAAYPELLLPFPQEKQFFGAKSVGGGKLDNFTKFVLIPAVRDASAETERKGIILQLIDVLVSRSVDARPDVKQLNSEFAEKAKAVYNKENLTELADLAKVITDLLSQYAPGASLDLEFGDVTLPKLLLPPALASLIEDDFKSPISHTGHGLQRALILALLQKLSLIETPSEQTADPTQQDQPAAAPQIPDLILGVEEPELYLHPSRSRFLSSVFAKLTEKPPNEGEPTTQIILGTHSPYFIDIGRFEQVRIARKKKTEGYEAKQCALTSYSKNEACKKLAAVAGKNPEEFSADSFIARAIPVMTLIVNEGFFGDVVVVVEGLSELGVLWALQEVLGKQWDARGIVVVPCDGKSKVDRPTVIFRGFGIPTYCVFDGDKSHQGNPHKEAQTVKLNRLLLTLNDAPAVDFPETQAHAHWATFEENLEATVRDAVGDEYYEGLREEVAVAFGYAKPSDAAKNPEVAAKIVHRLYGEGKGVPALEQVVERISALN